MQPDRACSKGLLRDALCAGGAGSTSDLDGLVNFRASEVSPFPHPLLSLPHFHRLLISLSLFIFFCQGGICCPTMAGNTSHWSFGTPPLSLERSQLPSLIPTLWLSCLFLDEPTALAPTPLASTPTSACYMRRHVFFLLLVSFMSFVPKLPQ